jgi:hypothetical protein
VAFVDQFKYVLEGVVPDKANLGAFNYVGSEESAFYAHADLVVSPDVVLLSASTLTLPAPLTGDLKDAESGELSAFVRKNLDRFLGVAYCYAGAPDVIASQIDVLPAKR